jgi:hypothetical protein
MATVVHPGTGKVTAIEKDTLDAAPFPGDPTKVAHKIAVVKVETPLAGVTGTTHLKIGFVPPPPPGTRPVRSGIAEPVPAEGQEALFFLTRHHAGDFYTMNWLRAPVDAKDASFKAEVENAKKAAAVLADPLKALKAEQPADRFFAATVLVTKYRSSPENADDVQTVKVPAEESRLVLKALAEQKNWADGGLVASGTQAMFQLGLTEADGWKPPAPRPGEPTDINGMYRDAFTKWLDGPGKTYQITKLVAAKK